MNSKYDMDEATRDLLIRCDSLLSLILHREDRGGISPLTRIELNDLIIEIRALTEPRRTS